MVSPQRTLRYPYNKVQGPPPHHSWVDYDGEHHAAWGMEPTTSSLGAMSPYQCCTGML
jgi:hypothetical protein